MHTAVVQLSHLIIFRVDAYQSVILLIQLYEQYHVGPVWLLFYQFLKCVGFNGLSDSLYTCVSGYGKCPPGSRH